MDSKKKLNTKKSNLEREDTDENKIGLRNEIEQKNNFISTKDSENYSNVLNPDHEPVADIANDERNIEEFGGGVTAYPDSVCHSNPISESDLEENDTENRYGILPDDEERSDFGNEFDSCDVAHATNTLDDLKVLGVRNTPTGITDGGAWYLIEQSQQLEDISNKNQKVNHRPLGEGGAYPSVVREGHPERPFNDFAGTVCDPDVGLIQTTPPHIQLRTQITQSDWEWVEDMLCGNKSCVVPVPKLKRDFTPIRKRSRPNSTKLLKGKKSNESATESTKCSSETENEMISSVEMNSSSSDHDIFSPFLSMFLPSVGPPDIIRYIPESEDKEIEDVSEKTDESDEDASLTCEFCGNAILSFPSLEQQQSDNPENLYCCEKYREFIETTLKEEEQLLEKSTSDSLLINVKPHPHFGSSASRKLAKQQAHETQQKRIILKRIRSQNLLQLPTSLQAFGRQMKTINYQLSSQKCMQEGWTLPTFKLDDVPDNIDVFMPTALKQGNRQQFIYRTYDDEQPFLIMFEDGSGTIFYLTGRPAVTIIPVTNCQFFYLIQDDTKGSDVLGTFDPSGIASCCFMNGRVRMHATAVGGSEYDSTGNRRRVWKWHELEPHVHAPPLYPITLSLNQALCVRIHNQQNILLTFHHHQRSCCFNIGTKLKIIAPKHIPEPEVDVSRIYLDDLTCRIQDVLDKINNAIRLSRSARAAQILPPLYLTSKMKKVDRLKQQIDKINKVSNKLPQVTIT